MAKQYILELGTGQLPKRKAEEYIANAVKDLKEFFGETKFAVVPTRAEGLVIHEVEV